MTCTTCQSDSGQTSKCVIDALDTIKQHFLIMQNLCAENAKTISQLKQHNDKLYGAIDLLQQRTESRPKSSPKRRRLSPKKPLKELKQGSSEQQTDNNASSSLPESQDSLNMNIALQADNDEEETITETEPVISPYKPWNTRRKLNILNCENEQPKGNLKTDIDSSWLGKTPLDKIPLGKTKMSLTLRSNSPRLKQTRLHFDAGKSNKRDCDKEVIESSPNLYTSLKQAKSRSLLQRADNSSDVKKFESSTASGSCRNQPSFTMDDDESFFDLCPDPVTSHPPKQSAFPTISGSSNTSSVMLLTPATQDIVFVDDDSIDEPINLNTMDFMAEVVKDNDEASLRKLQEFEAKIIEERQKAVTKKNPALNPAAVPIFIKPEPLTEPASAFGNESTKLPEDFEMEEDEQEDEEEYLIPRPIIIKDEPDMSIRERYNINCEQCEKYIKFMGTNLNDEKIRRYLNNCNHYDERELENKTPEGFWNPHMVSFAEGDPRKEVLVDRRFVDQKKKEI